MFTVRFIPAALFSILLFFSQQNALLHVLHHAYNEKTQQQDKQTPHPNACEQCTSYSQLGSTLNSSLFSFDLLASLTQELALRRFPVHTQHTLTATARGPPAFQRSA